MSERPEQTTEPQAAETPEQAPDTVQEAVEGPAEGAAEEPVRNEELEALRRELEKAQAQAQENWDKFLRAQAEMENLRKRAARDLENAQRYALERFVSDLLSVRDSLELGVQAAEGDEVDAQKIKEGTELTLRMLVQVMEKYNIKCIDPKGEKFNPDLHQAMSTQESREVEPNTVLTVMQKGYTLNERLLRPAMVVVSKAAEGDS